MHDEMENYKFHHFRLTILGLSIDLEYDRFWNTYGKKL